MKSTAMAFVKLLALSSKLIGLTNANQFMKGSNTVVERVSEADIRKSLLQEIDDSLPNALGSRSASAHFSELEESLRPIFAALPKNQHGNLEHIAANYALHRLFVLRHGWVIKGLGPTSGKYNAHSPAGVLKDQVPSYIENLFDQHLGGKGFKLNDLAVLASTIEHLIQEDAVHRIGAAFKIHDVSSLSPGVLSYTVASEMLDTYMAGYILAENLTHVTPEAARKIRLQMGNLFNYWTETQAFVHGIQREVIQSASRKAPFPSANRLDIASMTKVVEAVSEQFGSFFHETVCTQLKSRLMALEHQNSGRIKASEFYKPALDGNWQFQESVGYLRAIGALEETDSQDPSVLIANYLVSPSNCITASGFYSVCCKNECEGLVGYLEKKTAAPQAAPATISDLVAYLPSSSISTPRTLSDTLHRRLDEIASHHGGMVPLHGRLFAQWMHHAYPRECPYPHLSGSTDGKLPEDWLARAGDTASEEEMLQYTTLSNNAVVDSATDASIEDLMPWSTEEELFVVRSISTPPVSSWDYTTKTLRSVMLFAVAASFAYGVVQTMRTSPLQWNEASEKYSV